MMNLPIFPLRMIAFPGEKIKLHVFEPRYKQLINELNDKLLASFGMPPVVSEGMANIGTEVVVENIERQYENGSMDIIARGKRVFSVSKVIKKIPHKPYSGAEVEFIENVEDADVVIQSKTIGLYKEFQQHLSIKKELGNLFVNDLSFKLGHYIGLSDEQKLVLLATPSENERLEFINEHLELLLPLLENMELTQEKIKSNGHFKNFDPLDF